MKSEEEESVSGAKAVLQQPGIEIVRMVDEGEKR